MRKFSRGSEPVDMARTKEKYHNQWDETFARSPEHTSIGDCLYERQNRCCAYCETRIAEKELGFIEHLERRSDNPQRTFDWANMFFSCRHEDSCGCFKDNTKQRFNPADIVDPAQDDPADFFDYDMNGRIFAKDTVHQHRANETIRVFNLNGSARLTHIRYGIAQSIAYFLQSNPAEEQIPEFLQYMSQGDCPSVCGSLLRESLD